MRLEQRSKGEAIFKQVRGQEEDPRRIEMVSSLPVLCISVVRSLMPLGHQIMGEQITGREGRTGGLELHGADQHRRIRGQYMSSPTLIPYVDTCQSMAKQHGERAPAM